MTLKYIEIYVKNALSKSRLQNTEYALNPYKGCEHRCAYCYSPYVLHIPLEEWNTMVYVKRNIPTVLDKELRRKKGHVEIGTVTDAYQPAEKKYELTRKCLYVLQKHKVPVSILTKSSLITRDLDILKRMNIEVGFTITTLNDEFRKKVEPFASSVEERLYALTEISEFVKTYVFIGPIFPNHLLDDLEKLLLELKKIHVSYVLFDKFRAKRNMIIPEFLKSEIPHNYLGIKNYIYKIAKRVGINFYFVW